MLMLLVWKEKMVILSPRITKHKDNLAATPYKLAMCVYGKSLEITTTITLL